MEIFEALGNDAHLEGLNPPPPSIVDKTKKGDQTNAWGQKLLQLTRSLDKKRKRKRDDMESDVTPLQGDEQEEILKLLRTMASQYARKGLLLGDVEQALKMSKSGEKSIASASTGSNKRRKGGRGRNKNSGGTGFAILQAYNGDVADGGNASGSGTDDAVLVLSALTRLLSFTTDSEVHSEESNDVSIYMLIEAAANVLTCITEYIKQNLSTNAGKGMSMKCTEVEYELIASGARNVLKVLGDTMKILLAPLVTETNGSCSDENMLALNACFNTSASLVTLLGTRLSRSTVVLSTLISVGQSSLAISSVQKSAVMMLAAIPLAGNADGISPPKLWTAAVMEACADSTKLINTFFPLSKKKLQSSQTGLEGSSVANQWLQSVTSCSMSQVDRQEAFYTRLNGLTSLLVYLLRMEGYDSRATTLFTNSSIPFDAICDTVELLLAFPTASESRYHGTRSRLRDVPVEDGLLSPNNVMNIANEIKVMGHAVFDVLISSTGPSVISFGKRIMTLAVSSLWNSSSVPLRTVMDPISRGLDGKKKKRRWLHTSIILRTVSIRTLERSILAIGSNAVVVGHTDARINSRNSDAAIACRGIVLAAGSLLEQIGLSADPGRDKTDDSIVAALDTLASCVAACGGFIPSVTRETIDSTALTCFTYLVNGNLGNGNNDSGSSPLIFSRVKCAVLKLGLNCVCAPWSDGAMSNLADDLHAAASASRFDRDKNVSSSALSVLGVLDALSVPRAPPVMLVSQRADPNEGGGVMTAPSLLQGIQAARKDAATQLAEEKKRKVETQLAETEVTKTVIEPPKSSDDTESTEVGKPKHVGIEKKEKSLPTAESLKIAPSTTIIPKDETEGEDPGKELTAPSDDKMEEMDTKEAMDTVGQSGLTEGSGDVMVRSEEEENIPAKHELTFNSGLDDESDDELPPIVDCGPDEEDR
eukprot:scaffold24615_cov62-Attheya_sp.AAC.4